MKLLHFLFLSALSPLLVAQAVIPSKEPGADIAEVRLRVALWECFGLREEIEVLEIQAYAPHSIWLDESQTLLLNRSGFKSNPSAIGSDIAASYVWSGSSRDLHTRLEKAVTIRFRLRAWVERVTALRPLRAGESLATDAISLVRVPWKSPTVPGAMLKPSLNMFSGMVLTRSLAKGAVLLPEFVAAPPAVREGETVSFLVKRAGMSLRTEAVALQSGRVGDLVFLKRLDTGLRMRGIVWGPGVVQPQGSSPERQARQ